MQKVTKELLAAIEKGEVKYAPIKKKEFNVKILADLLEMVRLREITLIGDLTKTMSSKISSGSPLFQVWMMEESDLIQAVSKAYGERICLEQLLQAKDADSKVQEVLARLGVLFAYGLIAQDLAFFLRKSIITAPQGQTVLDTHSLLIKEFYPYVSDTIKGLGIPEHLIYAPIAKDWKQYNAEDNRGEVYGAKL